MAGGGGGGGGGRRRRRRPTTIVKPGLAPSTPQTRPHPARALESAPVNTSPFPSNFVQLHII
eukprot:3486503-Pyramimonas_sp.AAC.1